MLGKFLFYFSKWTVIIHVVDENDCSLSLVLDKECETCINIENELSHVGEDKTIRELSLY